MNDKVVFVVECFELFAIKKGKPVRFPFKILS